MPKAPNHHRPLSCPEPGVNLVHQKTCVGKTTAICDCDPSFQGQAWSKLHQRNLRRTFGALEEAKLWREETIEALADPTALAPGQAFFDLAASNWLAAAKAGTVRTRSGTPFKPAALRSYEDSIRRFLAPRLGRTRLADITRTDIQDVIDWMVAQGYAPSTVRNAVLPLRSILRRAVDREEIETNPTERLDLPIDRRKKDRVAPPEEVDALLDVLPDQLRLIWALALYTGLRRGELQALGWKSVDLEQGTIEVERSWDRVAGFIDPKSRAGFRRVPLPGTLRPMLVRQRLRQGAGEAGLVLGDGQVPFDPSNAIRRAKRIWAKEGLGHLGYHECRHTYASLMIAAGVNAKTLSIYMGHSSIVMTMDRYGHLFPGNEKDSAEKLDAFLARDREPFKPKAAGGEHPSGDAPGAGQLLPIPGGSVP